MTTRLGKAPWLGRLLQALGLNSVPAFGYFGQQWSVGTTLAVYWIETVLVIACVAVRIILHRRVTRKAGHWNVPVSTHTTTRGRVRLRHHTSTLLAGFLTIMGVFTAAHGVFLAMLVFVVLPQQGAGIATADLSAAVTMMGLFLALGLATDLIGLRERSFRWIERTVELAQGRMFVTHLTIIFGMGAMAYWGAPGALFAVFVGLKTLVDLGSLVPERELQPDPPGWLAWLDRFGPGAGGQTFSAHFRKSVNEDRLTRESNERVVER